MNAVKLHHCIRVDREPQPGIVPPVIAVVVPPLVISCVVGIRIGAEPDRTVDGDYPAFFFRFFRVFFAGAGSTGEDEDGFSSPGTVGTERTTFVSYSIGAVMPMAFHCLANASGTFGRIWPRDT